MVFRVLVTVHIGEMTVRETLAFSARVQGVGAGHAELLLELSRREKEANIKPDPDLDLFIKAGALDGQEASVITDYIIKIVGAENSVLISAAEQIFGAGGKRLKPALVFLVSRATADLANLKELTPKHRRLAEVIEMIHTASLIHDDVLNDSSIRRGKTLAFGIPALTHVLCKKKLEDSGRACPRCFVLSPTRELAQQGEGRDS